MTLAEYVRGTAEKAPQREALVFNDQRLSYVDLENRSNQMARFLSRLGLKKGDRVGLLMPNCIENVVYFLSVLKAGCIEVNLSPDTRMDTIIRAFKQVGISALICMKVPIRKVRVLLEAVPEIRHLVLDKHLRDGLDRRDCTVLTDIDSEGTETFPAISTDADPALIQFTSGTTGEPKGATLTQNSFIRATEARNEILKLGENSGILNVLRLSHSCSKSLLFDALILGAVMVLARGFVPPASFLKTLLTENITIITGPPFLFHHLLHLKNRPEVMDRLKTSLKFLEIGLSGAPPGLFHDLRKAFPWVSIVNRYGLTENAGAASLMLYGPQDFVQKAGACGKGTSETSLEMFYHCRKVAPKNRLGEIRIKGSTLMVGYWEDLKQGRHTDYQRDGFDTGDLAERDSDGTFYVTGRKDDIMKVAGERIAPKEIEDVILQLPNIIEAAIFGVEDGLLGEKIVACCYAKDGNRDAEVKRHCERHLPPYMVPHVMISSNTALPRNQDGKISKQDLRKRFQRDKL